MSFPVFVSASVSASGSVSGSAEADKLKFGTFGSDRRAEEGEEVNVGDGSVVIDGDSGASSVYSKRRLRSME